MQKYMLGIDLGTTNVKAALYTFSGTEIMVESKSYTLQTDRFGAATQSMNEIKNATFNVIQAITKKCKDQQKNISFVSFSAAMHTLLLVDANDEPLTPVFTWGDRRAQKYVNETDQETASKLYHRTGTPIHPMNPLIKLIWLNHEYPEQMNNAHRVIGIKSFLFHQMFGKYYTDYSIANATGLFNMHTLSWDKEALEIAGIRESQLAKIVPTTEVFRGMKQEVADELGLPKDLPLVIGASDGCLANLGVNAIDSGKVALTIGTSGAIRSVTQQPMTDEKERTFCYALTENHWVVGGPVNNGGIVLDWAKDRILDGNQRTYDDMMQQIETTNPGADGLFFHPYLVGERAPIWRTDVKGSFFGLDLHHTKAHLLRAVLEGINFNLYTVYRSISEVIGDEAEMILATGGFTKSDTWLQMIADIFGIEFAVTEATENGCLGAGILGLLALGEIKDLSNLGEIRSTPRRVIPNQKTHEIYQTAFKKYEKLNQAILTIYDDEK